MACEPDREWYGSELFKATGAEGATLYQMLHRLRDWGLATSRDEDPELAKKTAGPARTYYRLTDAGLKLAEKAVARLAWYVLTDASMPDLIEQFRAASCRIHLYELHQREAVGTFAGYSDSITDMYRIEAQLHHRDRTDLAVLLRLEHDLLMSRDDDQARRTVSDTLDRQVKAENEFPSASHVSAPPA